jgi:hypothetical protein
MLRVVEVLVTSISRPTKGHTMSNEKKPQPEVLPEVPRKKPLTLADLEISLEDLGTVRGGTADQVGQRRDIGPRW